MIYTIGHRNTYLKLFKDAENPPYKIGRHNNYNGGSVFETRELAQRYLDMRGMDDYQVFGVEADWDTDTAPRLLGRHHLPFNDLLIDAKLVLLCPRSSTG